jgi:hypothetical protein
VVSPAPSSSSASVPPPFPTTTTAAHPVAPTNVAVSPSQLLDLVPPVATAASAAPAGPSSTKPTSGVSVLFVRTMENVVKNFIDPTPVKTDPTYPQRMKKAIVEAFKQIRGDPSYLVPTSPTGTTGTGGNEEQTRRKTDFFKLIAEQFKVEVNNLMDLCSR